MSNCIRCDKELEYFGCESVLAAHKAKKIFCSSYCQAMAWKENNPHMYRFSRWKSHAKKNGREFTITPDDLDWPTHCKYLGMELRYIGGEKLGNSASLDRIDSSKGYIKGNVQIVSDLANIMKNAATEEQLITFAKNVLEIHNA